MSTPKSVTDGEILAVPNLVQPENAPPGALTSGLLTLGAAVVESAEFTQEVPLIPSSPSQPMTECGRKSKTSSSWETQGFSDGRLEIKDSPLASWELS